MSIALDKACFLALVLETCLYGVFTVLFISAVWVILRKDGGVNHNLLWTVTAIWILSTTHWILDVVRAEQAFVERLGGSASIYYLNLSNPLQAAKTAVYVTLTLVGDSFVVFRCFVVWGRRWYVVVFPVMLLAGTGAAGYGATVAFSRAAPGAAIFLPAIIPWVTSFITMTLCTNILCTFLIAYRIMAIQNALKHTGPANRARGAVTVVVESASVYSSSVLALMITYLKGSNAQYAVLDLTSPLIGIAFSAIILRVSLGLSVNQSGAGSSARPHRSYNDGFAMSRRPVAVNVSYLMEVDADDRDVHSAGAAGSMVKI